MSRYETYKPSGIDWIGEVPEHFKLRRFKNEFLYLKGKNPKETFFLDEANGRTTDMPYLSMEYLRNENAEPEFPEKDERLVSVEDGESLLLWDGSNAGEFIKSKKGYLSSTMVRIDHHKRMNSKYAFYIFQSYERILRDFTNGMGIPHINGVLLNNSYLPITHNEAEQLAIANYLDDHTQKIDRLIANKKAQAEKLRELRQIEINSAVTKGLNPNAEMKDSGIEWLGRINNHYKFDTFKRVCKLKQGLQIDQELRFFEPAPNRLPYITIKAINKGEDADNVEYIENADKGVICNPDEILLARTGATGEVVTGLHGVFHNNFFKIIFNRSLLNKDYLVFYLNNSAIKSYLLLLAGTTTIPDLNHRAFFSAPIVIPEINEQIEIANYLQKRTIAIDQLIKNIEAQIEKLQELRKIKIYEAVTGKIKVNAYAETTA